MPPSAKQQAPTFAQRVGRTIAGWFAPVRMAAASVARAASRVFKWGATSELPVYGTRSFTTVTSVTAALRSLEYGNLGSAAYLCDAFGSDDRIKGVLDTRVDALLGLPLEVESSGSARAKKAVESEFGAMFPVAELKKFMRWGLLLRAAFGRLEPVELGPDSWRLQFKCWEPHNVRWDVETASFWTKTDGEDVEITPGRNGWIVYAPDGLYRGWMQGLVRSLALLYLTRRWAYRDWARWSEVHGMPIRLAVVPEQASEPDKQAFESSVQDIGGEAVFRVAQDGQGNGFNLKLIEAASQSSEGFRKLIEKSDECIAVDVLGQTLTTATKGAGSYALGDIHNRIRLDRLEGDAQTLAATLREQALRPWAEWIFGSADFAPIAKWSTKAVSDRAAGADALGKAGDALKKLRAGGLNVDRVEFAKQFRVPLVEGEPTIEPQPIDRAIPVTVKDEASAKESTGDEEEPQSAQE